MSTLGCMKLVYPLLLLGVALLAACGEQSTDPKSMEASRVTVLDRAHKPLLVVEQQAQLQRFNAQWVSKRNTGKTNEGTPPEALPYYLDVQAKSGGGWRSTYRRMHRAIQEHLRLQRVMLCSTSIELVHTLASDCLMFWSAEIGFGNLQNLATHGFMFLKGNNSFRSSGCSTQAGQPSLSPIRWSKESRTT